MEFTTTEITDLYKGLSDLRGEPVASSGERGQPEIVYVPYQLGEKAIWNAAKNRSILKRFVIAHDEVKMDMKAEIDLFKKTLLREARSEQDEKQRGLKMQAAQDAIQDKVDEMNTKLRKISKEKQVVDGLLFIPAKELFLKSSKIPPPIVSELMPLIDGEPEFAANGAPEAKK